MEKIFSISLIGLLIQFVSVNVLSAECYSKSPDFIKQGDEYFNWDDGATISSKDQRAIRKIFRDLRGEWTGGVVIVNCSGPDRNPRRKLDTGTAEVVFSQNSLDLLVVEIMSYFKEKNLSKRDKLSLVGKDNTYQINVNANSIKASSKFWQRLAGGGTRLSEVSAELDLSGSRVSLDVLIYSNGVFVASQELSLRRL